MAPRRQKINLTYHEFCFYCSFKKQIFKTFKIRLAAFFDLSSKNKFWAPKAPKFLRIKVTDNFLCWRTIFGFSIILGWSNISRGKKLSASLKNCPQGACQLAKLLQSGLGGGWNRRKFEKFSLRRLLRPKNALVGASRQNYWGMGGRRRPILPPHKNSQKIHGTRLKTRTT